MTQTAPHIPTLRTERLVLRAPRLADWPAYRDLLAGPRSVYVGGPYAEDDAWGWFASDLSHWTFFGHGTLWIEDAARGETVGQVAILNPPAWPQPELGFMLLDGCEGHGYASEGAAALRTWYYRNHAAPVRLVSFVAPPNTASARIMDRLGAAPDPTRDSPLPGYTVYVHPAPEAMQ